MQTYDSYKDSGIDWLGEIPSHWEVKKLKFFGFIYSGLSGKKGDDFSKEYFDGFQEFVPFTTICNYSQIKEERFQYVKIQSNELQNDVRLNDLLFLMSSETLDDIAKVAVYLIEKPAYLNSFCKGFRITSSNLNAIFTNYLLNSKSYRKYFELCGRGFTRINIKQEYINDTYVTFPPLHEQEAIARFLDDKCEKIDELVAIKEQQIDKLKELRQVKIHQAVTKGINPNVEMKNSGIDWIGEIPKHWEVRRFKFLCSINTGSKNTEDKVDDGLYPFYVRSQTAEKINTYSYDGEAILTAGDGAGVGKVYHYVNGKFDYHQRVYKFSDFNNVIGKYLYHFLYSEFYNVAILGTAKSTVDSLRLPLIQDFIVTFPNSKVEQEAIVAYLEEATNKIDQAIAQRESQIEKLKAYKQSLINEVVTGKVKVC